jgi:hypothetical protein
MPAVPAPVTGGPVPGPAPRAEGPHAGPPATGTTFLFVCLSVLNTVLDMAYDKFFQSVRAEKFQLFQKHGYNSLPFKV